MHTLHELFLSADKMADGVQAICALMKRKVILFHLVIVLGEGNQA